MPDGSNKTTMTIDELIANLVEFKERLKLTGNEPVHAWHRGYITAAIAEVTVQENAYGLFVALDTDPLGLEESLARERQPAIERA